MKLTEDTRVTLSLPVSGPYWSGTLAQCRATEAFCFLRDYGLDSLRNRGEYGLGIFGKITVDGYCPPARFCPYCGGGDVVCMDPATVFGFEDRKREDPWEMEEYQCRTCENRSFVA